MLAGLYLLRPASFLAINGDGVRAMKIGYSLILGLLLSVCSVSGSRELVDELILTIYDAPSGEVVTVTRSMAERPGLNGQPRSLREVVLQELKVLDARAIGADTGADPEKFLERLVHENHVPRSVLMQGLEDMGYTEREGMKELARCEIAERARGARVMADRRLMIERSDIEAYDEEHPEFHEECFHLAQACSPSGVAADHQFSAEEIEALSWEKPFMVPISKLADDRRDIVLKAKKGDIVDREEGAEGLLVTRLVAHEPPSRKSVDERYQDIERQLHFERLKEVLEEYENKLLQDAVLHFIYPEDRSLVFGAAPSPVREQVT